MKFTSYRKIRLTVVSDKQGDCPQRVVKEIPARYRVEPRIRDLNRIRDIDRCRREFPLATLNWSLLEKIIEWPVMRLTQSLVKCHVSANSKRFVRTDAYKRRLPTQHALAFVDGRCDMSVWTVNRKGLLNEVYAYNEGNVH